MDKVEKVMDRRGFLRGLLNTTCAAVAAPFVAKEVLAKSKVEIVNEALHKTSIRTGLPQVAWRKLYQGIPIVERISLDDNNEPVMTLEDYSKMLRRPWELD